MGSALITDGFSLKGGGGERSTGIFVGEGSSVTVSNCRLVVGGAEVGGILVSRGDLTLQRTTVSGLISTGRIFGIDAGYGDIVITDCQISGGTTRYGIYETGNVADPISLKGNVFVGSLLAGAGVRAFYCDRTNNVVTNITTIDALNSLDENGLNPAGSVSGNTARPY